MKMGNKELIVKEITDNGPKTASELANVLDIDTQNIRIYLGRLREEKKIKVIDKDGREFLYEIKTDKTDASESSDLSEHKECLKFLNDFFKENIDHLMKSDKIVDFVLKNDDIFKEVERLIKG